MYLHKYIIFENIEKKNHKYVRKLDQIENQKLQKIYDSDFDPENLKDRKNKIKLEIGSFG